MSPFDPMAAAIDWLDAYRAAALNAILILYDDGATVECGCDGRKIIVGKTAISEYWRQRFVEKPALELEDILPAGDAVAVSYRTPDGIVQAILDFNEAGKIERCRCGPAAEIRTLRPST
jgi:hypothetical protein